MKLKPYLVSNSELLFNKNLLKLFIGDFNSIIVNGYKQNEFNHFLEKEITVNTKPKPVYLTLREYSLKNKDSVNIIEKDSKFFASKVYEDISKLLFNNCLILSNEIDNYSALFTNFKTFENQYSDIFAFTRSLAKLHNFFLNKKTLEGKKYIFTDMELLNILTNKKVNSFGLSNIFNINQSNPLFDFSSELFIKQDLILDYLRLAPYSLANSFSISNNIIKHNNDFTFLSWVMSTYAPFTLDISLFVTLNTYISFNQKIEAIRLYKFHFENFSNLKISNRDWEKFIQIGFFLSAIFASNLLPERDLEDLKAWNYFYNHFENALDFLKTKSNNFIFEGEI